LILDLRVHVITAVLVLFDMVFKQLLESAGVDDIGQ
jgi:hypothetical protein